MVWTATCLALSGGAAGVDVWAWPEAPPVVEVSSQGGGVEVASVVGEVQVRRPQGAWEALAPGRALSRGDEIRTADFSEVVLRDAAGATVSVTPNTTFILGEESPAVSRFTLGAGKIAADIRREPERRYEFGARGGEARADTSGAAFSLVADGKGLLGVVTRRGEVGLAAKGKRVVVGAGRQAVALPGKAPGDPLPIPDEVFLQVKWPAKRTDRAKVAVVGHTDSGARIRVGGRAVTVGPDGAFRTEIPLEEGENTVVVVAEDAAGNVQRRIGPTVVRETRRPSLKVKAKGSIWE